MRKEMVAALRGANHKTRGMSLISRTRPRPVPDVPREITLEWGEMAQWWAEAGPHTDYYLSESGIFHVVSRRRETVAPKSLAA